MAEYHLTSPLKEEEIRKLKIGDTVYISGNVFTCRSRLQRYIFDEGNILPFDHDRTVMDQNISVRGIKGQYIPFIKNIALKS